MDKKYKRMKRFYDRTSKPLRELIPGELIRMYHPGNTLWLLGKCNKRWLRGCTSIVCCRNKWCSLPS